MKGFFSHLQQALRLLVERGTETFIQPLFLAFLTVILVNLAPAMVLPKVGPFSLHLAIGLSAGLTAWVAYKSSFELPRALHKEGLLIPVLTAPISRGLTWVGWHLLTALTGTIAGGTLLYTAGRIVGAEPNLSILAPLFALSTFFSALGLAASLYTPPSYSKGIGIYVVPFLILSGGCIAPVELYGPIAKYAALLNPVHHGVNALLWSLNQGSDGLASPLLSLALLSSAAAGFCVFTCDFSGKAALKPLENSTDS